MKITKIREVKTPTRGTECSAGIDFYVPKGFTARLTSGTDILVPSGIRAEVPHGYALIAMNRSSVATSTDAMRRAGLTPKANTPQRNARCRSVRCRRGLPRRDLCTSHQYRQKRRSNSSRNEGGAIRAYPVSYEGVEVVDEEELFNQATERGKGGFGSTNNELI